MAPRLITAPTEAPVDLLDVKPLIRVTDEDEDVVVQALIDAAIGALDGWGGWLGRAMMTQTWGETLALPGPWVLALPDADADTVVVTVDGTAVDSGAIEVTLEEGGAVLTLTGISGSLAEVQYACALPATRLKTAKTLIGLMVDAWYYNRSAAGDQAGLPLPCLSLLDNLRWHSV